jgi:hypothetical protein
MRTHLLLFAGLLALSAGAAAQTDTLLHNPLPKTKEEFTASEPGVIRTVNYLENTPIDKQSVAWRAQAKLFVAWLTSSPQVTIDVDERTTRIAQRNPEMLIIFMGGWTRYVLQNGYSKDRVQGIVAGLRSAIRAYKMGNGFKRDKEMEKLIQLEEGNGLEDWVREQLGQKSI